MTLLVWTMIVSGSLLLITSLLFKLERNKGRRLMLSRVRAWFDVKVSLAHMHLNRFSPRFGGGSLRVLFHYVLHQVLGVILFIIRAVESRLNKLRHHNKLVARTATWTDENGHLHHIAMHKKEMALSPEEIEARKHRSLHD